MANRGFLARLAGSSHLLHRRWQSDVVPRLVSRRNSSQDSTVSSSLGENDEDQSRQTNLCNAVNDALAMAMEEDHRTLCFGEDVSFGGVFRCTVGLKERFGNGRVFNTPLCEQGIVGFGIGAASMGFNAVAEVQFADYIFPAIDQIVNEAAKMRYRSGGNFNSGGLTIRAPCGSVGHGGHYHSQSPEAFFTHSPGLKIVMPSGPKDAKGLLLAAIKDPNPVIFLEPKRMYRTSVEEVPIGSYTLPIGLAEVKREGSDITMVGWGATVEPLLQAAEVSAIQHGIHVEVIDLRTLIPWDVETVMTSVKKTGRVIISHEAPITSGFGAEIAAVIADQCFFHLESPPVRVCGQDTPFPLAFESVYLPTVAKLVSAVVQACRTS